MASRRTRDTTRHRASPRSSPGSAGHATACPAHRPGPRDARGAGAPRVVSHASRSSGAIVAAGAQTELPTSTPDAPALAGGGRLPLEHGVVDAARQQDPWQATARRPAPRMRPPMRARSSTAGSYGNSALRMSAADGRQAACGLDDAPPARFARQLAAGHRIEPQRLDEQRQVGGPAGRGDLCHEPLLVCGVRRLVVVVDEQLGRRGTQALRLLDRPAGQHPADRVPSAAPRSPVASIATSRPARPGSEPSAMHWAAPISGSRRDPVAYGASARITARLNSTISCVGHRSRGVRPELLAQILAVIQREHGEGAARRGAGLQPASRAEQVRGRCAADRSDRHGTRTACAAARLRRDAARHRRPAVSSDPTSGAPEGRRRPPHDQLERQHHRLAGRGRLSRPGGRCINSAARRPMS